MLALLCTTLLGVSYRTRQWKHDPTNILRVMRLLPSLLEMLKTVKAALKTSQYS